MPDDVVNSNPQVDAAPEKRRYSTNFQFKCLHCGNDFNSVTRKAKFCSDACRNRYYREQQSAAAAQVKHLNGTSSPINGTVPEPPAPAPMSPVIKETFAQATAALTPAAQLMFEMLKKEAQRWEDAYNKERDARKKLKEVNEQLRNELAEIKTDIKIKEIESKKPSGLNGFLENPLVRELAPHVGQALGKIIERMMTPGALEGTAGQLDAQVNEIITWIGALPESDRNNLYEILTAFASAQSDQARSQMIERIKNLVKNGTTIQNPYPTGAAAVM